MLIRNLLMLFTLTVIEFKCIVSKSYNFKRILEIICFLFVFYYFSSDNVMYWAIHSLSIYNEIIC